MYKGFSTINKQFSNSFTLTNFALVKQDLLNHFSIRKGEKLHNPEFGSIIWNVIFNQMTQAQIDIIEQDIRGIISYDPRINVETVDVRSYEHGIQIEIQLLYVPNQTLENLLFSFNTDENEVRAEEL